MTTRALLVVFLLGALAADVNAAGGPNDCGEVKCDAVKVDLGDKASLQRGARTFVNYCLSCHSAAYMRYNRMGLDLGIPEELVKENLMFTTDKAGDLMKTALRKDDAQDWFGTVPPDLTLVTRWRSPEWVYTYLRGFYRDDKSTTGWNNVVFANVAMPHVLSESQGEQRTLTKSGTPVFERFELAQSGTRTPAQFDGDMRDLTNFLVYLGEPAKLERYRLGIYVLLFLALFFVVAYLLKKEYWKDVH